MFNKVSATTASLQTANQTVDDLLSSGESEDESDVEGEKSEEEVVSHVLHSIIIKAGNPDKIVRMYMSMTIINTVVSFVSNNVFLF